MTALLRAVTCAASLVTMAGCTMMIPSYERPAAPVAAAFPSAPEQRPSATPASEIDWQDYFGDPRLKRLIEIALRNNRDLRVAVLNIEQARAQYQVRRADELPTVNVGATGSRQPTGRGSIASTYTAGLAVTAYELDFFGRVRSLSEAALAQFLGTEEARRNVQIALVSSVANAYLNMVAGDELLALAKRALATREESFRLLKLKYEVGAASELDYRQAESLLQGARAALAQLTRQRALDENALVLLLGRSLPADLPQGSSLSDQGLIRELPVGVPSEVLARRPDVRLAEQQLIAANANIGAARAAFFPRITLTGSAGVASSQLSGLFKSGSLAWSFMPQLLLPIFDSGRTQAGLDAAIVGRDIALTQYEKAIQTAFREVADALAGRATLVDQLRAQEAQANAEAARLKLAELRYQNGASSYLDVLDARRSLFAAQQAVVQVRAQQVQNQVTLYKVLGGGWKAP